MARNKKKIIRAVTVPNSIGFFEEVMIQMQADGYESVVVTSPGPLLDEFKIQHPDIRTIAVEMERHISIIKDTKALLRLINVFHAEKPYMVHSMTPKAGLLCMVAAWMTRVPRRVHTFTGLVWPTAKGLSRRILMLTDWLTCSCATHIIPEGEGVKNDLQNHITRKPMKVLGYGNVQGVDMNFWSRSEEVDSKAAQIRQKDVFTFVFVGRIVGDKGINELVEAFLRLLEKGKQVRLILVGNYEKHLDPVSDTTQARIDCTPEIQAVGPQYGTDLKAYYAASDCFVFPSYREGFPNTVLEAGAMGLPSIVTDINGSREIIVGELRGKSLEVREASDNKVRYCKNGMIIPSKDADALYHAMLNMVENKEAREIMAANARPMIESRFEQGFVRKCLFEFYNEILGD